VNKKKEMSITETATLVFLGFVIFFLILLNVKSIFFSEDKDMEPVTTSYTVIVNSQNGEILYKWTDVSDIRNRWGQLEVFPDSFGDWITIGGSDYIYYENGKSSPISDEKQVKNTNMTP